MEDSRQKRQRVSKGRYNQYLKEADPFEHAPPSSRRCLVQTQKDGEIFAGKSHNIFFAYNYRYAPVFKAWVRRLLKKRME